MKHACLLLFNVLVLKALDLHLANQSLIPFEIHYRMACRCACLCPQIWENMKLKEIVFWVLMCNVNWLITFAVILQTDIITE